MRVEGLAGFWYSNIWGTRCYVNKIGEFFLNSTILIFFFKKTNNGGDHENSGIDLKCWNMEGLE